MRNEQVMQSKQAQWDALLPSDCDAESERRFWIKEKDKEWNIAQAVANDLPTLRHITNDMGDLDCVQMHAIVGVILRQHQASDTTAEGLLRTLIHASLNRMSQTYLDNQLDAEFEADRD